MPKYRLIDEMGAPIHEVGFVGGAAWTTIEPANAPTPQAARDKIFEQLGWTMEEITDEE